MSLSGLSPIETVTAYQLLLELTKGIKELSKNPKALEDAIALAYSLPSELQGKADNARKAISDNQALAAEQKKDLQAINDNLMALDEQRKSLEIIQSDIDKRNNKLGIDLKSLEAGQDELKKAQKALNDDRLKLETEKKANNDFGASLDERESDLDKAEADLKARENKLKEIIGG